MKHIENKKQRDVNVNILIVILNIDELKIQYKCTELQVAYQKSQYLIIYCL